MEPIVSHVPSGDSRSRVESVSIPAPAPAPAPQYITPQPMVPSQDSRSRLPSVASPAPITTLSHASPPHTSHGTVQQNDDRSRVPSLSLPAPALQVTVDDFPEPEMLVYGVVENKGRNLSRFTLECFGDC
jgi:hypothetical protein